MKMTREIRIKGVKIGGLNPIVLIAGPCVIENERHAFHHASVIKEICEREGMSPTEARV